MNCVEKENHITLLIGLVNAFREREVLDVGNFLIQGRVTFLHNVFLYKEYSEGQNSFLPLHNEDSDHFLTMNFDELIQFLLNIFEIELIRLV